MNNRDIKLVAIGATIAFIFIVLGYATDFEGFFYLSQFIGGIATGIIIGKEFLTGKGE